MIGRIRGNLVSRDEHTVLVDVAGVGYELEVTPNTLSTLPAIGHDVVLFTHLSIREDAHSLFGFVSVGERDLFRTLIKISGVGPKLALTLLSGMDVADLARCIRDSDVARLVKLPGIGRKTAERLVVELKDRIDKPGPYPRDCAIAGRRCRPAGDRGSRARADRARLPPRSGEPRDQQRVRAGSFDRSRRAQRVEEHGGARGMTSTAQTGLLRTVPLCSKRERRGARVTIEPDRLVSGRDPGEEVALDRALRPTTLAGYIGQEAVKQQMAVFIEAARRRARTARSHVDIRAAGAW